MFTRVKKATDSRGTGLGLAIVRSIMNLHKGVTEVQNHPAITVFSWVFARAFAGF
ncbi:hypothetical protein [Pseudomonas sp. DC1.2]|uniref:hypothetical protein n=1 Tax=Pseudomonas sp. DC1.2 TaxID=3048622 RepID=UPI003A0FC87F